MPKNIESTQNPEDEFYNELRFSEQREDKMRGTADAVLEGLQRAGKIQRRELNKDRTDKQQQEKARKLTTEHAILSDAVVECGGSNIPAMQAFDALQKVIDHLEELPKKNLTERDKRMLEAAQNVQQRLLREAEK